jgi:hypothetical protein
MRSKLCLAALMAKLSLILKQQGMSFDHEMDRPADAVVQRETPPQILYRLSSITVRCTTCHDVDRLASEK